MVPGCKFRGYWLLVFAIGFLNFASAIAQERQSPAPLDVPEPVQEPTSGGKQRATDGDEDTQHQDRAAGNLVGPGTISNAPVSAPAADRISGENYCETAEELQTTRCRDVAAQEAMSDWAFGALILTGVGVILIWWTLYHTKKAAVAAAAAVEQARLANEAARDAVTVTREMGERQVRAYVNIGAAKVSGLVPNGYPEIIFELTNGGQSPAKRLRVRFRAIFYQGFPPKPDLPKQSANLSVLDVPANGVLVEKTDFKFSFSEREITDVREGKTLVAIYGLVSYYDVFGKLRRTLFRLHMRPDHIKDGVAPLVGGPKNNRST